MSRGSWDDYFMGLALTASTRATCPRRSVGAVLVLERHVLATGYNGSLPGAPHCTDPGVGCDLVPSDSDGGVSCVRTVHAELNAILQAARHGVATAGATLYTTASPCWPCFKALAMAGVRRVVYRSEYPCKRFLAAAGAAGIELLPLEAP